MDKLFIKSFNECFPHLATSPNFDINDINDDDDDDDDDEDD